MKYLFFFFCAKRLKIENRLHNIQLKWQIDWSEWNCESLKRNNKTFFFIRKFIVTSIKGNYHRNFKSSPVHCNFGFFSFVVWNLVNSWNTFCVRLFVCLYIVITSWFIGFFFIGHRSIRYFFFSLYTQPINLQVRAFRSDLAPEQNTRTKAESKKEIENVHFVNCLSLVHNKQNKYCGKKGVDKTLTLSGIFEHSTVKKKYFFRRSWIFMRGRRKKNHFFKDLCLQNNCNRSRQQERNRCESIDNWK